MGSAKKKGQELAPAQATAVAAPAYDYGSDAGAGFEGTKQSDLAIPFLNVLQLGSPQVVDGGMKSGEILNSVTGEVTANGEGIPIQPVHVDHQFVEWVPRDNGGGYVGAHDPESEVVRLAQKAAGTKFGKLKLPNGNDLIETYYLYVNLLNKAGTEIEGFAVLACTSTKITPYRGFNTAMQMIKGKPPIFAFRALLKTFGTKNKKNQPFHNIAFTPLGGASWKESLINPQTDGGLLDGAKGFREMVLSGAAKADFAQQQSGGEGDEDHAGGGEAGGTRVPF